MGLIYVKDLFILYLKKFYMNNNINEINGFKINNDLPKTYKFHKKK